MKVAVFLGFLACLPLANWLILNVGTRCIPDGPCLIPVGFGLEAPSGVLVQSGFEAGRMGDAYSGLKTRAEIESGAMIGRRLAEGVRQEEVVIVSFEGDE